MRIPAAYDSTIPAHDHLIELLQLEKELRLGLEHIAAKRRVVIAKLCALSKKEDSSSNDGQKGTTQATLIRRESQTTLLGDDRVVDNLVAARSPLLLHSALSAIFVRYYFLGINIDIELWQTTSCTLDPCTPATSSSVDGTGKTEVYTGVLSRSCWRVISSEFMWWSAQKKAAMQCSGVQISDDMQLGLPQKGTSVFHKVQEEKIVPTGSQRTVRRRTLPAFPYSAWSSSVKLRPTTKADSNQFKKQQTNADGVYCFKINQYATWFGLFPAGSDLEAPAWTMLPSNDTPEFTEFYKSATRRNEQVKEE
ncbi:hypothetical protein BJ741DRAFT_644782 [Chytriomyces cf. hyalinus JEL632]|nr:hypothetical protein BJ741DRAFT_644782 [Chytriomyces cf. hyalinus JEL632]